MSLYLNTLNEPHQEFQKNITRIMENLQERLCARLSSAFQLLRSSVAAIEKCRGRGCGQGIYKNNNLKSESNLIRPIVCNTEQPQLRQLCGAACRERTGGVMAVAAYRDSATNYYVPASASALCIRLYPSVSIEENTHKIHLFSVLCTTYTTASMQ